MLYSTPDYRTELLQRHIDNVPITDFLGSVLHVELSQASYALETSSTHQVKGHLYALPDLRRGHEDTLAPELSIPPPTVDLHMLGLVSSFLLFSVLSISFML